MKKLITRNYHFTKYGELVSKPPPLKTKTMYHPVLGKFDSEIEEKPDVKTESKNLQSKYKSSNVEFISNDLMENLRLHHNKMITKPEIWNILPNVDLFKNTKINSEGKVVTPVIDTNRLCLGQTVAVRKRICLSKTTLQTFVGLIIDISSASDPFPFIRVRNIFLGTGVELKIPLCSPLIEGIHIIKSPDVVPLAPNLLESRRDVGLKYGKRLGKRKLAEGIMTKYLSPQLLSEKGRSNCLRDVNRKLRESQK